VADGDDINLGDGGDVIQTAEEDEVEVYHYTIPL